MRARRPWGCALAALAWSAIGCGGSDGRDGTAPPPDAGAPLGDVTFQASVRSADGRVRARSRTAPGPSSRGVVEVLTQGPAGEEQAHTVFVAPHPPQWLAIDDDGDRLAWVSSSDDNGVVGLWLWQPGDAQARRLTNGGPRAVGRPPAGFVPNPVSGPPWFDGAWLRWQAEDGPHAVAVPR